MLIGTPPSSDGVIDRGGVRIAYQVFGQGRPVLLLPTWPIVHSDFWRLQVPNLARRYSVVAFDGRGNGASSRPLDPESYSSRMSADDALAVMDATGIDRAPVLSVSVGAEWAALLAAEHPERTSRARASRRRTRRGRAAGRGRGSNRSWSQARSATDRAGHCLLLGALGGAQHDPGHHTPDRRENHVQHDQGRLREGEGR